MGEWKACQQEKYHFFFAFSLQNSDFLYSVVNYSDFAYNPNKDEIKELLQPRSPAFGRGVASAFSGAGALRPWYTVFPLGGNTDVPQARRSRGVRGGAPEILAVFCI